jgi:hypothetical protein
MDLNLRVHHGRLNKGASVGALIWVNSPESESPGSRTRAEHLSSSNIMKTSPMEQYLAIEIDGLPDQKDAMKLFAMILNLLLGSYSFALAQSGAVQNNQYAGTGMSVTGPAADKKPPEPLKPTVMKTERPAAASNGQEPSKEEVPGVNSATTNSH